MLVEIKTVKQNMASASSKQCGSGLKANTPAPWGEPVIKSEKDWMPLNDSWKKKYNIMLLELEELAEKCR